MVAFAGEEEFVQLEVRAKGTISSDVEDVQGEDEDFL